MIDTKELRRLAQAALIGPDGVSLNWLKLLQDFQKEANPAAVSELLDRLEAAEKERDALRAKIEAMEKQEPVASVWRCDNNHIHGSCEQTLPMGAKLYALPGAQPAPGESSITAGVLSGMFLSLDGHDKAQPGYEWRKGWNDAIRQAMDYAQPAPTIPEGWKLVPIEPTPGMIDAAEYVDWGDADVRGSCINAWDRMLAAAPEAKP